MTKRQEGWICAAGFVALWVPLMALAWWFGNTTGLVLTGMAAGINGESPAFAIHQAQQMGGCDTFFWVIAVVGLVFGCVSCRFGLGDFGAPPFPPRAP